MAAPTLLSFGTYYNPYWNVFSFPGIVDQSPPAFPSRAASTDISENGLWVAVGGNSAALKVYNISDWSENVLSSPHTSGVFGAQFSHDSAYLAGGGASPDYIKVWDTSDWSLVTLTDTPAASIAFYCDWSENDTYLAYGHNNNNSPGYAVYEKATWTRLAGLPTPSVGLRQIRCIAISELENVIVLAYNAAPYITVVDLQTKSILWEYSGASPNWNTNGSYWISLSPDGKTIAVGGQASPYLRLLDSRTGNTAPGPVGGNLPTIRFTAIAYSKDGEYLFGGVWGSGVGFDYWDTATWTKTVVPRAFIGDAPLAIASDGSISPPVVAQNAIMHGMDF